MAVIPKVLWEPLNAAYSANVALVVTVMPDGFVQVK